MQDRQRECGGFAGTGLCDADHVAARHDRRYGLRLVGVWYFSSARARKRDSLSSKAVKELLSLQFVSVVKILLSICGMQNPPARDAHQPTCGWERTSRAIWAVSKQKNMKRARIRSEPKSGQRGPYTRLVAGLIRIRPWSPIGYRCV